MNPDFSNPAAQIHAQNTAPGRTDAAAPRPEGSVYMGGFRSAPLPVVRLALVGLGERSGVQLANLSTALPLWKPNVSKTENGASTDRQLTFIIPVCLMM